MLSVLGPSYFRCARRLSPVARSSRRLQLVPIFFFLVAVLLPRLQAQQVSSITTNLLTNPGAEAGSIAGWLPAGNSTPTVDSGTFDRGINPHTGNYDFLGQSGASDSLSQTVSLLTQGVGTSDLDSGTLYATVSFWEQGLNQGTPSDDAYITLTFLDASGNSLGTANSGEVDSHNSSWMNFRASYLLPVGTRSITYTMNFLRHEGSDLDAFVDDNLLVLSTPSFALSPTNLDFGTQKVGVPSAAQVVTVSNPGSMTLNIDQIILDLGASPSDFTQTNNCPAALPPLGSCQINVVFTPHGVGLKTAGLAIFGDETEEAVNVSGTGTGGILQVNPGNLKTIAGNGTAGDTGDGGLATAAELNQPNGVAFDSKGNLYIADDLAEVVRKVDTSGNISTFAGLGTAGYSGDGGPATRAQLYLPSSIAVDAADNIYIQDDGNNVIRRVDSGGTITTFAGTGTAGHAGDGGPATAARFNQNQGARFDKSGNFFVPQCGGPSVRKIDTSGIITTVAGNFTPGFSGDGGPAISAMLNCPSGVAIDTAGNFYIADDLNNRIRKVDTSGTITTIAGDGNAAFSGDGGPSTAAELNLPNDIAIDSAGNLYIADSGNNRIRKIDTTGIITTIAGGLQNAGSAGVNTPLALNLDASGNLYFSDSGNSKVQEVFPAGVTPFPATPVGTSATPQTLTLSNIGNVDTTIASAGSFTLGGNAADFALTGGTCLAGATLTANGGSCTLQITFTPVAAGLRMLTVSVTDDALNSPQSFVISGSGTQGASTLTWTPPAPVPYGTPLTATQLDAVATGANGTAIPGTFTYTPAAGTILSVGVNTLTVAFTSGVPSYGNATATVPITVTQATPIVAWATPANIPYGAPLSSAELNAVATGITGGPVSGTYTYTPTAGTVLGVGPHTLSVVFTSTDPNYANASGTTTLTVTQATPHIAWATPASIPYGTPLSAMQLNASATGITGGAIPGTYTYTPAAGTVLGAGAQTLTVAFTPADSSYASTSATVLLTVTQANPHLAWSTPASIPYGTPLSAVQLNAAATGITGATITGTYIYTPAAGTVLGAGTQPLSVAFTSTDPNYASASAKVPLTVTQAIPRLAWTPPAIIPYGTPLSATQLNAVATGITGGPVSGTYTYSPATGTVLGAGTQPLSVAFTSTDSNYANASATVPLTVTQVAPTLAWSAPASIPVGAPLSATQLNATATGVGGATLPGIFTYTPPSGTVLPSGSQTLTTTFKPTDAADYTSATTTVQILVAPLTLTSFTPGTARVGDPDKAITITGSGFIASSVVLVNGAAIPTTFVNATSLTAIVPAADFAKIGTLQVAVSDPGLSSVSASLPLSVIPATPAVTLTGPSTTTPGSQPSLAFTITNPYPVPLTASFNLLFVSAVTPSEDDPAIQFASGGRNFTFTVAANSVVTPAIQLQAGTVAGTITVPLTLTAQGIDVTPTTLQPVVIVIPRAIPVVSTTTITRSGTQLSVAIHGFSNTREVTTATFQFMPAAGATINTPDVTAPVTPLFTTWFTSATSEPYGSTFTYTQVFGVSDDAINVGSVQVTLTNSVGTSVPVTSQ